MCNQLKYTSCDSVGIILVFENIHTFGWSMKYIFHCNLLTERVILN